MSFKPTRTKYSVLETQEFLRNHQRGRTPEVPQNILPGWTDLLVSFIKRLEQHDPSICVSRVRSRHGGMTVYVDRGDAEVYRMIFELEHASRFTCEQCGRRGRFTPLIFEGEARTLCSHDLRAHLSHYGYNFRFRVPPRFFRSRGGRLKASI